MLDGSRTIVGVVDLMTNARAGCTWKNGRSHVEQSHDSASRLLLERDASVLLPMASEFVEWDQMSVSMSPNDRKRSLSKDLPRN